MNEVKPEFVDRGIHQRIENWAELSDDQRRALRHLGFEGLTDFLNKAERLANDQLSKHGLPTDWPRPAWIPQLGADGWIVPEECELRRLSDAHPNAEMASKLKLDVHRCREFIDAAEFRSTPPIPSGSAKEEGWSPKQNCSEYMFFGVVVGLAYWALLANVQFEEAVSEKRRRTQASSSLTDEDYRQALREAATMKLAAARLGVNERQIRNRIPREERDAIRNGRIRKYKKRKS